MGGTTVVSGASAGGGRAAAGPLLVEATKARAQAGQLSRSMDDTWTAHLAADDALTAMAEAEAEAEARDNWLEAKAEAAADSDVAAEAMAGLFSRPRHSQRNGQLSTMARESGGRGMSMPSSPEQQSDANQLSPWSRGRSATATNDGDSKRYIGGLQFRDNRAPGEVSPPMRRGTLDGRPSRLPAGGEKGDTEGSGSPSPERGSKRGGKAKAAAHRRVRSFGDLDDAGFY